MSEKKVITMKERFQMHAPTKSEGTRVYNVMLRWANKDELVLSDFYNLGITEMLKINGISRKAAKLIVDVVADLVE